jgi:hypothetical protein
VHFVLTTLNVLMSEFTGRLSAAYVRVTFTISVTPNLDKLQRFRCELVPDSLALVESHQAQLDTRGFGSPEGWSARPRILGV